MRVSATRARGAAHGGSQLARYLRLEREAQDAARRNGAMLFYLGWGLSTVFADNSGAAALLGGSAGLMLDRSNESVGPELVANGGFDSGVAGWTAKSGAAVSWDAGKLRVQSAGLSYGGAYQQVPVTPGKTYSVSFKGRRVVGGLAWLLIGSSGPGATDLGLPQVPGTTEQSRTVYVTATSASIWLTPQNDNTTADAVTLYDDISVREVIGRHAVQPNAAYRPLIIRLPSGYFGLRTVAGSSQFMELPYWDLVGAGSATLIVAHAAALTGDSGFVVAQSSSAAQNPLYSLAARATGSSAHAAFLRNDAGVTSLSFAQLQLNAWAGPAVVSAVDNGSIVRGFSGGVGPVSQPYGRGSPYTMDRLTLFAARRTTIANFVVGDFGLICQSATVMPDADRIAIERFGAFLVGAPYAG